MRAALAIQGAGEEDGRGIAAPSNHAMGAGMPLTIHQGDCHDRRGRTRDPYR